MSKDMESRQKTVQETFTSTLFRIPVYQRPYSWEEEQCETLWDDLYGHFLSNPNDPYFLGVIVLAKNEPFCDVIDGQQRLITLSLLLRAIKCDIARHDKLLECLYSLDRRDSTIKGIRFKSDVLDTNEQEQLEKCLRQERDENETQEITQSKYATNFAFFRKQITDILADTPNMRLDFTDYILDKAILLCVECQDADKALTIFETINDRGMNLTDGDIFKAKLYQSAKSDGEQDTFISQWNKLNESLKTIPDKNVTITSLFRCYMYLLRGEQGDNTKTIGLRDFFCGNFSGKQSKSSPKPNLCRLDKQVCTWQDVMVALNGLKDALTVFYHEEDDTFRTWVYILETFRNDAWRYPLLVFLYKEMNHTAELSEGNKKRCCTFMQNLARYVYAKGFGSGLLEGKSIEDAMFEATINASKNEIYDPPITISPQFESKLDTNLSAKFRRGFSAIIEFVPPGNIEAFAQREEKLKPRPKKSILYTADVEHILPQDWSKKHYEAWDNEKAGAVMQTLGNLMLLEKPINIAGSNNFFSRKMNPETGKGYKDSIFSEALALRDGIPANEEWTQSLYKIRHDHCKQILIRFFDGYFVN